MFRKLFLLSENTKSTIDFVIVEQETAFVPTEKSIKSHFSIGAIIRDNFLQWSTESRNIRPKQNIITIRLSAAEILF